MSKLLTVLIFMGLLVSNGLNAQCTVDAGTLTADDSMVNLVSGMATISATPNGDRVVPAGYEVIYFLSSGANFLLLQGQEESSSFQVSASGDYSIHTLVAASDPSDPNFLDSSLLSEGTSTMDDLINLIGVKCASVDSMGTPINVLEECSANAGTLTADTSMATLSSGTATISATANGDIMVPTNYEVVYVLTSGSSLVIEQTSMTSPSFEVSAAGDYTIHTLVAEATDSNDPNYLDLSVVVPGTTTGGDVIGIVTSNGLCASLDAMGAPITVFEETCTANAGTLTADATMATLSSGNATISATPNGDIMVPTNYEVIYVLTSGSGLVIEQTSLTSPSFEVTAAGDYTIHTLVAEATNTNDPNYLDLSVVVPGTTTGGDVIGIVTTNGLCASLDAMGAPITVLEECTANAGTLTADANMATLSSGTVTISATPNGDIMVPTNYEVVYVLTSGSGLVIEQTSMTSPSFEVTAAGDYTIHTLVAEATDSNDPNYLDLSVVVPGTTTGGDVIGIVTTNMLCASLDATGAPITVLEECTANAGTLTADASMATLSSGTATISATPNGDIMVPTNYEVVYVLTYGTSLVIEQTSMTSPSFEVSAAGDYTIHTLVAEATDSNDPNYLDLSVVVPGTTTGGDVIGIVTTNMLCASLDAMGAPVTVFEETCTANAGTLTADDSMVALSSGTVTISATPNGDIVVPTNYEVIYVLTSGSSLVIEQTSLTSPSFEVSAAGDYTIHTLVAEATNTNDPNYLDLSVVVPGTTTGGDVIGIVTSNMLCASLDAVGAPITVEMCTANAGTLTADASMATLSSGTATISATPNGDIMVPMNYEVVYVLTSGTSLVIEQTSLTSPSFEVTQAGDYTIHTLVAEATDSNDPNYLDLSVVVPGTTTGGDVIGIVTSNGLCASLDAMGAPVTVFEETCTANAGTLTADASPVMLSSGTAMISATANGDIVVPTNYEVIYVLTSGSGLVIEQTSLTSPSFEVSAAGDYTIHTLVAEATNTNDPNYLDLSVVVPGTTTGGDVIGIVTTNMLCASLDAAGAPITVEDALGIDNIELKNSLVVYPNPVVDNLNISNSKGIYLKSVTFFDLSGRVVKNIDVNSNRSNIPVNISQFSSGAYFMIISSDAIKLKKYLIKK